MQGVFDIHLHVTLNSESKVGCLSWLVALVANETAA